MLKQFFLICSGADTQILSTCSNGEQNKYAGIGATVFFTALMAWIAASYALFTVFDNVALAIVFGFIWGLLIFNLDRFIVSTIKKRNRFSDELIQASPRIILAIIIALVISKPLEIKLFEKEIDQVLLREKNQMTLDNQNQVAQQYEPKRQALLNTIATLETEISNKEAQVNTLYDTYISEAEGRAGTKLLGKGPVYKEKRDKHDAALAELQELKADNNSKIKAAEQELSQLKTNYDKQIVSNQPVIDGFDGLMARINALGKLPLLPSLFVFLLFLAVETSPILAKLLSPKGAYDFKLEAQETQVKSWSEQQIKQQQALVNTDYAINESIYNALKQDQAIYDYKKDKTISLFKLQADAFLEKQQKLL
jgi:hypothetical protein